MGEAKRRGTFEARKAEAEYYEKENNCYQAWLKEHRPRAAYTNSLNVMDKLAFLLGFAASTNETWIISND